MMITTSKEFEIKVHDEMERLEILHLGAEIKRVVGDLADVQVESIKVDTVLITFTEINIT